MECKFNDAMNEVGMEVRLDTLNIPKRYRFKYHKSIIQGNEDINDDITHHIGAAWMKCGGLYLESCVIKRYRKNSKVSFIEWWSIRHCCLGLSVG